MSVTRGSLCLAHNRRSVFCSCCELRNNSHLSSSQDIQGMRAGGCRGGCVCIFACGGSWSRGAAGIDGLGPVGKEGLGEGITGHEGSQYVQGQGAGRQRPPFWDGISLHSGRYLERMEVVGSGKSFGQIEPPLPETGRPYRCLMEFDHDAVSVC